MPIRQICHLDRSRLLIAYSTKCHLDRSDCSLPIRQICHLDRTLSKRSAPKGEWRDPCILRAPLRRACHPPSSLHPCFCPCLSFCHSRRESAFPTATPRVPHLRDGLIVAKVGSAAPQAKLPSSSRPSTLSPAPRPSPTAPKRQRRALYQPRAAPWVTTAPLPER